MMKRYGLVVQWYVANGWYGDRYRAILVPSGGSFVTKSDAISYRGEFRKVVQAQLASGHGIKLKASQCMVVELDELKVYEYVGFGPSIRYVHFNYVICGDEFKYIGRT